MTQDFSNARIFVQIASYRDTECQWTVKDLFEKAAHPERVFVGICWQYDPKLDNDCFVTPAPRPSQVRVAQYHASEAKGAGWARNQAQGLYHGEEYVLQIQAHMRFEPGWDETLIELLHKLPGEKNILTAWLPGYLPPDHKPSLNGQMPLAIVGRLGGPDDAQMVHLNKRMVPAGTLYGKQLPTCSWVGNFMFTRAATLKEVPFDPYIYFWGEEINYSARLWTHGYDMYHLDRVVLYHYWDREDARDSATYRNHQQKWNQRSLARNLHLFGIKESADKEALQELTKYKLGGARTLEAYWEFAGVDLMQGTIARHAREGMWTQSPGQQDGKAAAAQKPMIFVGIASFRDPEITPTLKDLFAKAAYPDRIRVGVCLQVDPKEDADCLIKTDRQDQLRTIQLHYNDSKGANWARAQAHSLWKGEEYVLQIDSHMRFEPGWDEALIDMLARCPSDKPVISAYLHNYEPPDTREYYDTNQCIRIRVRKFAGMHHPQLIHVTGLFVPLSDKERSGLYPSPLYIANFMFTRAVTLKEVPIDPHFQFHGDEISYGARLWTHGYDIFQPDRTVMLHYWLRKDQMHRHHYRDARTKEGKRSLARIKHLLGFEASSDEIAIAELEQYPLGQQRALEDWWAFSGVDWKNREIAKNSIDGIWNIKARDKGIARGVAHGREKSDGQFAIGKPKGKEPRIFINIASYRDPECQWTVKDLFEKAKHPDRINVGICWQFDEREDQHCFQVSTRPEQVRVYPIDWREAEGVCWARYQTQQLWDGEDYTLMTDSHMRFVPGWDELMIEELAACEADKPLLSCSPARYEPPSKLYPNNFASIRRVKPFTPDGNIRCQGEILDRKPEKPLNAAFLVANFIFSRSAITEEVPYDPYLYFDQEEISYALRLYTHGWDIFSARHQFLYHYYNDRGDSVRPLHWNDMRRADEPRIRFLRDRGLRRFNHLSGHKASDDPEVTRELDKYGLGRKRSLRQFEEYSGVDFLNKIASEKALRCLFIKDLYKYRDRPLYVPELDGPNRPGKETPPNPPAPAAKIAAANARTRNSKLEAGDFIPFFALDNIEGKSSNIEMYGGRHSMLFFLPAGNIEYVRRFFAHLHEMEQETPLAIRKVFVFDAPIAMVATFKKEFADGYLLLCDPECKVARSFGLCQPGEDVFQPTGYLLSPNLKILHGFFGMEPDKMLSRITSEGRNALEMYQQKFSQPQIITESPPMIIVPNALSPELCDKCIQAFKHGHTFEGTVGAAEKTSYRPNTKVRRDYIVQGELLNEIDDKLSRSLFPEIAKVFGFEVKYRELYKVGLYSGDNKGFFRAHRDNFDEYLGYRRIAMTIHLTDDFEGGGLKFPEYGENIYRPARGSAIAFSCATLHEALPVTRGNRYIVVGFFHSEQDEAYRRHYLSSQSLPIREHNYLPMLKTYPDLNLSREFYSDWYKENMGHAQDAGKPSKKPSKAKKQ